MKEDQNTCNSINHLRKRNWSISSCESSTSFPFSSGKNIINYSNNLPAIAHCEAIESEKERFEKALAYHRSRISQYRRDWEYKEGGRATTSTKTPSRSWPDNVPSNDDLSFMLEDIKYCNHSPNFRSDKEYCHRLKFRVASALLLQYDEASQKRGMEILRSLAETGMADAMAFYGICLNEGRAGLEPNAELAVFWFSRSVQMYLHPQSLYELGVAFYTGEGVVEDENKAVELFQLAAEQSHPAAAYMLGDCLLDGIGVDVDRGSALEWLVRASELGHRGARSRVMAVLEKKEGEDYGGFTDSSRQTFIEHTLFRANEEGQIIQRRTTLRKNIGGDIGGGPRNPTELQRRETIVSKSRKT
jgi:TPR repeat protein